MWLIVLIMLPFIIWADIKLFRLYFKGIFKDEEDLYESIRYSFTPDLFSLFKGEYMKDYLGEFKLGVFIMLCVVTVILEGVIVKAILF